MWPHKFVCRRSKSFFILHASPFGLWSRNHHLTVTLLSFAVAWKREFWTKKLGLTKKMCQNIEDIMYTSVVLTRLDCISNTRSMSHSLFFPLCSHIWALKNKLLHVEQVPHPQLRARPSKAQLLSFQWRNSKWVRNFSHPVATVWFCGCQNFLLAVSGWIGILRLTTLLLRLDHTWRFPSKCKDPSFGRWLYCKLWTTYIDYPRSVLCISIQDYAVL